jgi:hypothetical protein
MKERLGFMSVSGAVYAAVAVAIVLAWSMIGGAGLYSAGGLNAMATGASLGGVSSHAELGAKCEACHTPPWSTVTMGDRCMACHADIITQIQGHTGIHGGLLGALSAPTCQTCHSEHRGPNGPLTANFDHNILTFKLLGKHASVPCNKCHTNAGSLQDLRNTPQDCYSCHAKDDNHKGAFGTLCGQCHTPSGWTDATFDHTIFPVNHGSQEQVATCQTCHPNGVTTYTCLGCHRHTASNIASEHENGVTAQSNCIPCHRGGRGGGD